MKLLLAALLLTLFSFTSYAQATWPRNSKTGEVEFQGTLPWPNNTKTEAQRQALVRRWYLAKLTDETASELAEDIRTATSSQLITYGGVPVIAQIKQGAQLNKYTFTYFAQLSPTPKGLNYTLSSFSFGASSTVSDTPVEQASTGVSPNEQAALVALRKRLAVALASW